MNGRIGFAWVGLLALCATSSAQNGRLLTHAIPTLEVLERAGQQSKPIPEEPEIADIRVLSQNVDNSLWKALLERVRRRPTRVGEVRTDTSAYKIFIVTSHHPVQGQSCPQGTQLENSIFVSSLQKGRGGDIYPVRIRTACSEPKRAHGVVSLNMDLDGTVLEAWVPDFSKNPEAHPWCKILDTSSAENRDISGCLTLLAQELLAAP